VVAGLVTGGCSGGDSADGADGDAADRSSTDILVALGDVTAALQDERLATQSALLGDIDAPDAPGFGQANSATDQAMGALGAELEELEDADPTGGLELQIAYAELGADLAVVRNERVLALPTAGGRYEDGGRLAGRFDGLVAPLLDLEDRLAAAVDDPALAPLAQIYAGVSRQIERIEQLIALTTRARSGGQPAAPEEIEAAYAAVVEARPAFADLAADTDVADATDTLDGALHAAGFGGPSAGDPGAPSDLFVPSLSLGAWQAYRDVVRDHILTGTSRGPQTQVPGDAVIASSPMKTL
jgi:Nitrate and nitrite sensing